MSAPSSGTEDSMRSYPSMRGPRLRPRGSRRAERWPRLRIARTTLKMRRTSAVSRVDCVTTSSGVMTASSSSSSSSSSSASRASRDKTEVAASRPAREPPPGVAASERGGGQRARPPARRSDAKPGPMRPGATRGRERAREVGEARARRVAIEETRAAERRAEPPRPRRARAHREGRRARGRGVPSKVPSFYAGDARFSESDRRVSTELEAGSSPCRGWASSPPRRRLLPPLPGSAPRRAVATLRRSGVPRPVLLRPGYRPRDVLGGRARARRPPLVSRRR